MERKKNVISNWSKQQKETKVIFRTQTHTHTSKAMHTISLQTVLGTVFFFPLLSYFSFDVELRRKKKCQRQRHIGNHVFRWIFFSVVALKTISRCSPCPFFFSLLRFIRSLSELKDWRIVFFVRSWFEFCHQFCSTVYDSDCASLRANFTYFHHRFLRVPPCIHHFLVFHFRFLIIARRIFHFFFLAKSYACVCNAWNMLITQQNNLEKKSGFYFRCRMTMLGGNRSVWTKWCWQTISSVQFACRFFFFSFSTEGWQWIFSYRFAMSVWHIFGRHNCQCLYKNVQLFHTNTNMHNRLNEYHMPHNSNSHKAICTGTSFFFSANEKKKKKKIRKDLVKTISHAIYLSFL